jgi:peptide/nickel transport system substrate-binding protein
MGLSAEPDRLDPTTSSSLYTRYVMSSICEKLYDLDAKGTIVPQLASGMPTISADGLTVGFGVRSGVRFADGTPFDAAPWRPACAGT